MSLTISPYSSLLLPHVSNHSVGRLPSLPVWAPRLPSIDLFLSSPFVPELLSLPHDCCASPCAIWWTLNHCCDLPHWRDKQRSGTLRGVRTSCDPQHSHNADDGGIDGQGGLLNLLQGDTHDGQQHDDQVQLVPPTHRRRKQVK